MDITPQLLKEVKFSDAFRGYDRDEVDEFLERVGAGVALVQGRLRDAVERAEAAEARAHTMGGRSEAEETLKRTLVLAQRTADAAVAEANETAQRTLTEAEARAQRSIADAEAQAQRTISEAEAHSSVLRAEAEAEARRVIESTRAPLLEEIADLERIRNFLRDDVTLLEGHLSTQRDRLRSQINDLAKMLDEPDMMRPEPAPETSGIDPAAELGSRVELAPPVVEVAPASLAPADAAGVIDADPDPAAATDGDSESSDLSAGSSGSTGSAGSIGSAGSSGSGGSSAGADADFEAAGFDSSNPVGSWNAAGGSVGMGGSSSSGHSVWDDPGPATQPVQALTDLESGGDSFLDQLRRAVDEEGEDDGAMTAFFDQDDDDRPKSRFGRRR